MHNEEKDYLLAYSIYAALKLEFIENKKDLEYQQELELNSRPIKLDILVIKKSPDVVVNNEIGAFFREYNIFEYKSSDDNLNIDTFYKGIAYACIYKVSGAKADEIKAEDITLTFVRQRFPKKLFSILSNKGVNIEETAKGIYRIHLGLGFTIQIVVGKFLEKKKHIWLSSLTPNLEKESAERLLVEGNRLTEKDDNEHMKAILDAITEKNKAVFLQVKEELMMCCEALREIMKPELDAARIDGEMKGERNGKIIILRDLVEDGILTIAQAADKIGVSEEEFKKM